MKPRIFIVEDDEGVRELLRTVAETAGGSEIETFESAEAFLASYDPARPGRLVFDTGLPGLSGLDLVRQLSAQKAKLSVLMISGSADIEGVAEEALRLGAAGFLVKPFDVYSLLNRIREQMEGEVRTELY